MVVRTIGERGKSKRDREVSAAIRVFVGLLICHCFMWLVVFGGSVIVE